MLSLWCSKKKKKLLQFKLLRWIVQRENVQLKPFWSIVFPEINNLCTGTRSNVRRQIIKHSPALATNPLTARLPAAAAYKEKPKVFPTSSVLQCFKPSVSWTGSCLAKTNTLHAADNVKNKDTVYADCHSCRCALCPTQRWCCVNMDWVMEEPQYFFMQTRLSSGKQRRGNRWQQQGAR